MESNFVKVIKEFLIDELGELKGQEKDVYLSDLACELTERINVDGSVHCSSYKAKEFIKENFEEFGDLLNYYVLEFGEIKDNPFTSPEKREVIAYIEGIRILLSDCETLQEADKQSEYNNITLTGELIDKVIQELENNNFDIRF